MEEMEETEVVHVTISSTQRHPLFVLFMPGNSLEIRKLCFLETLPPSAIIRLFHEPHVVQANN